MSRRLPKKYRPLVAAAVAAGAEVTDKRHGLMVKMPDGSSAMLHCTPGEGRAYANAKADLRRIGVEV